MAERNYRQNCSVALGADLLGERWTLLIIRELLIQPCRYSELVEYLSGMGTNLLARRLRDLESQGLVEKTATGRKHAPYVLTRAGREVEPVVLALIRWGYLYAEFQQEYQHLDHWDLLAMKAFFSKEMCESDTVVQFQCRTLEAWVRVSPDGFHHAMGLHELPDLQINSSIIEFRDDLQDGHYYYDDAVKKFAACFIFPDQD